MQKWQRNAKIKGWSRTKLLFCLFNLLFCWSSRCGLVVGYSWSSRGRVCSMENYSTSWKLKYCWMMTDCIINWLYKIDSGSDRFNCFALEVRFRSAVILFHSCQELLWQITLLKWKYCNNQPPCESPASTTGTNGTRQIFDRFNALRCFHLNHAEI